MRIDARYPAGAVAGARPGRTSAGGGFSVAGKARPETARAGAAAPLASLDAILMLQGEDEAPGERRRRSARRAGDLLDGLDRLKAALLAGRVPAGDLHRIADTLKASIGATDDPTLDGIVAAIELRAAVELAKLGVAA